MADPDIPIAYATAPMQPVAPPEAHATLVPGGRSQRVFMNSNATPKPLPSETVQALQRQGFTLGLIQCLQQNSTAFPLRFWVVDNSGSMSMGDGHRLVSNGSRGDVKLVSCTRWTEIQETVDYHAQMAGLLEAPTVFRLLNDPGRIAGQQQFSIAERGREFIPDDLRVAEKTMRYATPSGVTPLAAHVHEIRDNILAMLPQLQETGGKVVVVLATDGLPTDPFGAASQSSREEFQNSLRQLEGLPVWIVIRLCTDEDAIVEYYNDLDAQLELSLEVLDDFCGEANEVHEKNPWLNYALPLHRMREMGFHHRLFDLLDERPYTIDELKDFMFLLFGEHFVGVPHPNADWDGFCQRIYTLVHNESKQWNPRTKKMEPWVDVKKLRKVYGGGGACSIM